MSADTGLDLTVLEDLDFAYTPECEWGGHETVHAPDDPARWVTQSRCPGCGSVGRVVYLCESGRQRNIKARMAHRDPGCGHKGTWDDFVIRCDPLPEGWRP